MNETTYEVGSSGTYNQRRRPVGWEYYLETHFSWPALQAMVPPQQFHYTSKPTDSASEVICKQIKASGWPFASQIKNHEVCHKTTDSDRDDQVPYVTESALSDDIRRSDKFENSP